MGVFRRLAILFRLFNSPFSNIPNLLGISLKISHYRRKTAKKLVEKTSKMSATVGINYQKDYLGLNFTVFPKCLKYFAPIAWQGGNSKIAGQSAAYPNTYRATDATTIQCCKNFQKPVRIHDIT